MSTQRLSAYAQLYNNYYNLARAYISYRVKNKSDADDLAQEVFTRVYRGMDDVENPHAWIYTMLALFKKMGALSTLGLVAIQGMYALKHCGVSVTLSRSLVIVKTLMMLLVASIIAGGVFAAHKYTGTPSKIALNDMSNDGDDQSANNRRRYPARLAVVMRDSTVLRGEIKTFRNGDILGMENIKEAGRGVKNGGKRR